MAVCLDAQIFYVPPVVAGPKPATCRPRVQEESRPAAISGVPLSPSLLQTTHNPQPSSAGGSQADAILIPTDDELDDVDGRSDASFDSLDGLPSEAGNKVQPGRISDAGKDVDAASVDDNAPEPSVTSMAGPGKESHASPIALPAEQERLVSVSPISFGWPVCAGWSRLPVDRCPKHPNWTPFCRRFQKAKADDESNEGGEPKPADTGPPLPPPNSQLEADHHPTNELCPAAPPQVAVSRANTPKLPDDGSTAELEPADAEPCLQAQSLCDAASSRGVDPQQGSGSCRLSSVQTSDSGYRHPLIPDDGGEQDEGSSVVPPQAQASRAGMPSSSGDEIGNEHELANTKPSMLPSASQERANLQHDIGRCRRRRRRDTDDEEDCSPIVRSDAKQGEDEDAVQPPRGKRRKVNTSAPTTRRTAPKRQARVRCTDSRAQRPPPTQGPKRRHSQRSISKPQSSGASALEEETLEAAFASFEEWPLEAVLKRVWVGGTATFQVEFTWNPCTDHGQNDRAPESPQRKPFTGRISSTARALPSRVASTTKKVQGDEYFNVEEILEWRQGEKGLEYLVKWQGMGRNTILGNPLRISSSVLRSWSSSTRRRDCLHLECRFRQNLIVGVVCHYL